MWLLESKGHLAQNLKDRAVSSHVSSSNCHAAHQALLGNGWFICPPSYLIWNDQTSRGEHDALNISGHKELSA
jgi:hypothetical protein